MLETRVEAAGIALQGEVHRLNSRLQLRILAGAAGFMAVWGGVVLLAIALPPHLRVPVLAAVVGVFVALAVIAHVMAGRKTSSRATGSLHWFFDNLRQDLEVVSRALARSRTAQSFEPRTDGGEVDRPGGDADGREPFDGKHQHGNPVDSESPRQHQASADGARGHVR